MFSAVGGLSEEGVGGEIGGGSSVSGLGVSAGGVIGVPVPSVILGVAVRVAGLAVILAGGGKAGVFGVGAGIGPTVMLGVGLGAGAGMYGCFNPPDSETVGAFLALDEGVRIPFDSPMN